MYFGLNRTLCDVLEEMRKCHETRNYSFLLGLIEEAQSYGNRMEAALADGNQIKEFHKIIKEKRDELSGLRDRISIAEKEINANT